MPVDLPSLKPVWYILDSMRWGQLPFIFANMAFSIILDICDLTTIGLISSSENGPLTEDGDQGTCVTRRDQTDSGQIAYI